MENSYEILHPPKDEDMKEPEVPSALNRTCEYVRYQDALKNLELSSENHLNEKKFLDKNDPETLHFENEFASAVEQFFPREFIKYTRFRGRKAKSFAAWLVLNDDIEKPFRINEGFLAKAGAATPPKVTAVTLLNSNEVRLLRVSLKGDGSRLYEIVNGSCKITFAWKVGEEESRFTLVFYSDGKVKLAEGGANYCDLKDLAGKEDVFVRLGNISNPELTLKDIINKLMHQHNVTD